MNVQRQKPSRPSWAIGRRKTERPAVDLVIDATILPDAVHEDLELARNMRRQLYARALVHGHRMPARVRRKLLLLMLVAVAVLATAGVAAAANGGFAPVTPESPNATRTTTAYYVILGFTGAIFVLVESLLVVFIWKYRSRGRARTVEGAQVHGHTRLELIWTVIPVIILCVIGLVVFYELPGDLERACGRGPAARHGRRAPVLLAVRLSERRTLDQRPPRTGRSGRRPRRRIAGRDPQLVDPGARRQDPGDPGADEPLLVQGRQGGHVHGPVRRALRALPREDGGARDRRDERAVQTIRHVGGRAAGARQGGVPGRRARRATACRVRAATGRTSRPTRC